MSRNRRSNTYRDWQLKKPIRKAMHMAQDAKKGFYFGCDDERPEYDTDEFDLDNDDYWDYDEDYYETIGTNPA